MVGKKNTFEMELWFFGRIDQVRSSEFLLHPVNIQGSFLVRNSEREEMDYTLVVKNYCYKQDKFEILKYKINFNNGKFFVSTKQKFESLPDLINAFQEGIQRGIACQLTTPCQIVRDANIGLVAINRWELPRNEIEFGRKIGSGHFGTVHMGVWRGSVAVAIKALKSDSDLLLDHGDLLNLLRSDEEHSLFDFDDLLRISLDITNGMCAVSKKGIVHRDIAARNILIDKWYRAKVGDFGMSCDTDYVGVGGTDRSSQQRVMSGLLELFLWETFSYGESPYATIEPSKIIKKVNIGYRLDIPKMPMSSNDREEDQRHKEKIYKIMLLCWCKLPEERPSFIELRQLLKDFKNVSDEKLNYDYADYERRNGYQKKKKTKKKTQVYLAHFNTSKVVPHSRKLPRYYVSSSESGGLCSVHIGLSSKSSVFCSGCSVSSSDSGGSCSEYATSYTSDFCKEASILNNSTH
ncbi:SRC [Lepeophtheirus salmonis]|uniref:Tyrosine-protein kinase n=1 Tax=Lepeophtheirus salmonis TaxID=72036 RepID=A0A7R8H1K1_LEPSM|nr:SRC [Lepeophtheirus salmonis]CAF2811068.1 SRC [Lepeophtheirus salmonis]